jgi:hypothetical protein
MASDRSFICIMGRHDLGERFAHGQEVERVVEAVRGDVRVPTVVEEVVLAFAGSARVSVRSWPMACPAICRLISP